MRLLRKLYSALEQGGRRGQFATLCKRSGLKLDYNLNGDSLSILKDICQNRCYATYFPFYQSGTILDIGAHKGYFSLFAALHAEASSRIVCLEPCESNYQVLVVNLKANGVKNVTPVQAGLAATSGTAEMFLSRNWNNSLLQQHRELLGDTETTQVAKIKVYSLKDLLEEYHLEQVDFLKLDCEGAEYPALFEAAPETLQRIRTIAMEFHDTRTPRYTGLSMIGVLRGHGFHIAHFSYAPTNKNLNYGKIVATRL